MKITIQPCHQMTKGRTKVWVDCDEDGAQAYELRDKKGKLLRRERTRGEAERIAAIFSKPRGQPVKDRRSLAGKRWADVKDRL